MKNKNTIAAIVPMRHSSERVPGKNYRSFAGQPLFFHIIKSLLSCKSIDTVIIDTDSSIIIDLVKNNFPNVFLLERPDHLKSGSIPMNDVLLNIINQCPADFYIQTHSTNPILSKGTIEKAIDLFLSNYPINDTLFTVTKKNVRFWDGLARPINHNQNILLRTQDLPAIYEENSCLYLFTKEILLRKHNRIGDRPYMFEIPEIESQDIDVEINFLVAEVLFKHYYNIQ